MKWKLKLPIALAVVGGAAALIAFNGRANTLAREALDRIAGSTASAATHPAAATQPEAPKKPPFDGKISIDEEQLKTLGVEIVSVSPQSEPLRIEVTGRTDYDQDTLTQIRPRFNSLVDKVHVRLGERITKGAPLVDLFSTELAKAKSDYEKAQAQWDRDKKTLSRTTELHVKGAISDKDFLEDVNDERKSAVDAKVALDSLLLYGMNRQEIAGVEKEEGEQKGKMSVRSPVDGIVIKRDVVPGVLYSVDNVLLVIAPLDHFWVYGNIYPSDASRVSLNQPWMIHCANLGQNFPRTVESISSSIDPDTKTVRVRTTISNANGQMKSDMYVTGYIEVPPKEGRTVIPRLALVSADGADYVFVKVAGDAPSQERFERRAVRVAQERSDQVVVSDGLKAGEQVAARGSLILAQIYEDAATNEAGAPQ